MKVLGARKFTVGVFREERKRSPLYRAYTIWFSPDWKGCCVHTVEASRGTLAKHIAIAEHKAKCEPAQEGT